MTVSRILKAIAAAYAAGVGSISTAYVQGNGHIGLIAGLVAAGVALTALAGVWAVPNTSSPAAGAQDAGP